jgi:hypothetical protein
MAPKASTHEPACRPNEHAFPSDSAVPFSGRRRRRTPGAGAAFAGSTANPNDGVRTVFAGNQITLASFDVATDRFVFDHNFFALGDSLNFANSLAANLPSSGINVVVIQDNSTTTGAAFNAGNAANLIAQAVTSDGAGFFHNNSGLQVNRLVYSTNLNSTTADLSILARINSPAGPDAVAALPDFTTANFALARVPEPETYALLLAGLAVVAVGARASRGTASGKWA